MMPSYTHTPDNEFIFMHLVKRNEYTIFFFDSIEDEWILVMEFEAMTNKMKKRNIKNVEQTYTQREKKLVKTFIIY